MAADSNAVPPAMMDTGSNIFVSVGGDRLVVHR
jgi:hypothetical protein